MHGQRQQQAWGRGLRQAEMQGLCCGQRKDGICPQQPPEKSVASNTHSPAAAMSAMFDIPSPPHRYDLDHRALGFAKVKELIK